MTIENRNISDSAVIELLETKTFFSLPKIYREIIRSSNITDKERCFLYELFFDFLEYWRKGSKNNILGTTVKKLADKYKRGVETIRRYLRALENANLIRKIIATVRKDGKIITPIIGVEFVLPDIVSQQAITNDDNRNTAKKLSQSSVSVDKSQKKLSVDNKTDHSSQVKDDLQDNKIVGHILDQDLFKELLDHIFSFSDKNKNQKTINKYNLAYIIKRLKKLPFSLGKIQIKQIISQMLHDLNKDNWGTDNTQHKLNIILKMIEKNTYRIYVA
jgi:hypothetical protein